MQRPERRRRSRLRSFVTALQTAVLLVMGASVGVTLGMFINLSKVLPKVVDFQAPEATIIYSSDGVILGRVYVEDRTNVPLKDIPQELINATVAIEDSRFYAHSGVDVRGIARAAWENLRGQKLTQGGSTITQQLARNVYLSSERTVRRKLQEAILAVLMERRFTKDRVLELYLNQIYYGSGAYGVQAAAKVYFGKDVGQLTLPQAAMLAGLPRAPSYYCPHANLRDALDRRDVVLNRMAELGYITPQERDEAKSAKLDLVARQRGRNILRSPHFVDYVTQQLRERYGNKVVVEGGLRVYTTLNYEMQKVAEKALREGVKRYEGSRRVTEGCLVCIEPANGYIRAMVGGVDPKSQYNRCTQACRNPGSSFKLFVYLTAFESGMDLRTREVDSLVPYPDGTGGTWTPRNYNDRYARKRITLRQAIYDSVNTVAVKTAQKIGIRNVIETARSMGISSELGPYLSLAIGGSSVYPIEMASAYGTMANNGVHVDPVSIIRIANSRGEIIDDFVPEGDQVISERAFKLMDEALRDVVMRGTGTRARAIKDARGKTGTTNEDRDAWWVAYVPNKLVAAVWVGNDNYAPMRGAYGGRVCAPIWVEFMRQAIPIYDRTHRKASEVTAEKAEPKKKRAAETRAEDSARPDETRSVPADVGTAPDEQSETVRRTICDETGLLATDNCPSTHSEPFARGNEPKNYCTSHGRARPAGRPAGGTDAGADSTLVGVNVCAESGMLAGSNCPRAIRRRMPIDHVPTQICAIHSRGR